MLPHFGALRAAPAPLQISARTAVPRSGSPRPAPAASSSSASSPARALHDLRAAVAGNDLPRFQSTLIAARPLADGLPIGAERNSLRKALLVAADLETVWKFSASDPSGSYYGDESLAGFHDRLSADYSDYARFIEEFRVTDQTGRTFYPTAETRAFLARQLAGVKLVPKPAPARKAASVRKKVPGKKHRPDAAKRPEEPSRPKGTVSPT